MASGATDEGESTTTERKRSSLKSADSIPKEKLTFGIVTIEDGEVPTDIENRYSRSNAIGRMTEGKVALITVTRDLEVRTWPSYGKDKPPIENQDYFGLIPPGTSKLLASGLLCSYTFFSNVCKSYGINTKRKGASTGAIKYYTLTGRIGAQVIKERYQEITVVFCDLAYDTSEDRVREASERQKIEAWLCVVYNADAKQDMRLLPTTLYAIKAEGNTQYLEQFYAYLYEQQLIFTPWPLEPASKRTSGISVYSERESEGFQTPVITPTAATAVEGFAGASRPGTPHPRTADPYADSVESETDSEAESSGAPDWLDTRPASAGAGSHLAYTHPKSLRLEPIAPSLAPPPRPIMPSPTSILVTPPSSVILPPPQRLAPLPISNSTIPAQSPAPATRKPPAPPKLAPLPLVQSATTSVSSEAMTEFAAASGDARRLIAMMQRSAVISTEASYPEDTLHTPRESTHRKPPPPPPKRISNIRLPFTTAAMEAPKPEEPLYAHLDPKTFK